MGTIDPVALYQAILEDTAPYHEAVVGDLSDMYADKRPSVDASVAQYRVAVLLRTLFSKFEDDVLPSADEAALVKFLECNERCAGVDELPATEFEAILLGEYRSCLADFFLTYDREFATWVDLPISKEIISNAARHGPGAAQGAKEQSYYAKHCSSTLTATSAYVLEWFEEDAARFDLSAESQVLRSAIYGERVVDGNTLAFVPKKRTISRVTCTEALANMYYQLGLGSVFEEQLRKKFHIDFRGTTDDGIDRFLNGLPLHSRARGAFVPSQAEYNAWLARKGSRDGSIATIDLVSASDTISLRRLDDCPSAVKHWIKSLRSPVTELPDGRVVTLNMISTMGNGFTFALQTIFFSCAVRAVYRSLGIPVKNRSNVASVDYYDRDTGNWGVFGDDIVVVSEAYRPLCRLLHLLGFEVNHTKSFNDGLFRESCGSDWLDGQFVRGIYLSSLMSLQDHFVAFNRLAYWSCFSGVPLTRSLELIYHAIPPHDRCLVPLHENDDAGLKVPQALKEDLGSQVAPTPSDWGSFMRKKARRLRSAPSTGASLYRCFRSRDLTYDLSRLRQRFVRFRKHGKWRFLVHSPAGIYWCAIGNKLRDGSASSRMREPVYSKTVCSSSGWNYYARPPGALNPLVGPEEMYFLLDPVIGSTRG